MPVTVVMQADSCRDAAFLTAAARRGGSVPASWGASNANKVPSTYSGTSFSGTYVTPTATTFP